MNCGLPGNRSLFLEIVSDLDAPLLASCYACVISIYPLVTHGMILTIQKAENTLHPYRANSDVQEVASCCVVSR